MSKMKTKTGVYVKAICCQSCDWYQHPEARLMRAVCPKCGSPLHGVVGRFTYTETKGFLSTVTDVTGFTPKGSENIKVTINNEGKFK